MQKIITAVESGKEYQQTLGFYNTLGGCLKAIAKNETGSKSYKSLKEYIEEYNQIVTRLEKILVI